MLQKGQLIITPANQTKALENSLPGAMNTKGMVWLKDVGFTQGTIDIDLRGKNVFLQSFPGIAFHGPVYPLLPGRRQPTENQAQV